MNTAQEDTHHHQMFLSYQQQYRDGLIGFQQYYDFIVSAMFLLSIEDLRSFILDLSLENRNMK